MRNVVASVFSAGALALIGLYPAAGHAATTYDLTVGNAAISGYPSPYGTVSVSLVDSNTATITFTADATGGYQYLFGAAQAIDINTSGASTISNISGTHLAGFGTNKSALTAQGSGNVSSFGTFNQTIDSFDGFTNSWNTVTFTVDRTDNGTWGSSADVLTANSLGNTVAAHIFVCVLSGGTCSATQDNVVTGFATNGLSQVPLPPAAMLFGTALAGIGFLSRRRKKIA